MELRVAFETLGEVVAHYESHTDSVRNVETTTNDGVLRATLTIAVSLDSLRSVPTRPTDVTVSDGEIQLSVSLASLPRPPSPTDANVSVTEAAVADDEPVVTLTLLIEPETGTKSVDVQATERSPDHGQSAAVSTEPSRSETPTADSSRQSAARTESGSSSNSSIASESSPSHTATLRESNAVDAPDESTDRFEAVRDESVPPYEDTAYLQALYDACDNFGEMSRKIAMDVSSETVRRYMIEAGVHQPASYNTTVNDSDSDADSTVDAAADSAVDVAADSGVDAATDSAVDAATDSAVDATTDSAVDSDPNAAIEPTGSSDTEPSDTAGDSDREVEPVAAGGDSEADRETVGEPPAGQTDRLENTSIATDGLGLPDGLGLDDVADAVVSAATVHQVQRELGLERAQTRRLLDELNLIDLVSRRLADCDRTISYDQVFDRLSQCAPSGA